MGSNKHKASLEVFSTCPASIQAEPASYGCQVADVARWSELCGCKGILVYSDNSLADPWLVSQIIIENTARLCPLVAVQPIYQHPYSVAKMLATFGYLYGRRIYLNMVAGGFKNDLAALDDTTPHDKRYDRLTEYTLIIKRLLAGETLSFTGEFYKVDKLKMTLPLAPELFPGIFVSGSSEAGLAAARAIGAVAIKYPKPSKEESETAASADSLESGIRVGIIAREKDDTAWEVAYQRFPVDRKGQLTHQLAMKTSDSVWHKHLSAMSEETRTENNPYWLVPFQNYKTFCPYLVGSYGRVATELARYIAVGYKTIVLDIPPSEEELNHTRMALDLAAQQVSP